MKDITAQELQQWMQDGSITLLDVREPGEYASAHIAEAQLLPLSRVSSSTLGQAKGRKIVVYCQKGRRGEAACAKLSSSLPDQEIYNLEGGIEAWTAAGMPVVGSRGYFLPLDRQVQLAVGTAVLIGSVLGFFLSPLFFILSGFLGLGLMFAGLSGICGLAHVLARMPWNARR